MHHPLPGTASLLLLPLLKCPEFCVIFLGFLPPQVYSLLHLNALLHTEAEPDPYEG